MSPLNERPRALKPLERLVAAIITRCRRWRWAVTAGAAIVAVFCAYYVIGHFQINTRTRNFISSSLPWRQDMIRMDKAFPQNANQILVVIDGKTMELAESAARNLAMRLRLQPSLFRSVERQNGGPFFNRNALLFMPADAARQAAEELARARPLFAILAYDPSLRGIANAFSSLSQALAKKSRSLGEFARPISALAAAFEDVLSGRPVFFSWETMFSDQAQSSRGLRQIISVKPILNYTQLQPGQTPIAFIRDTAAELGLVPQNGVTVRLTGAVPIADEEYSALTEGLGINNAIAAVIVIFLLWLAVKSPRIVLAAALCVCAGLIITAAAGLELVGAFNLISLAFGVLFVGIGTDFAIQFCVRYRNERQQEPDFDKALSRTAHRIGRPLALAALATAAGFYSFLPTDYLGLKDLGLIAGTGMFIAFFATIALLPALLSIFGTPPERNPIGFGFLAPLDRFMARHRIAIVVITLAAAAAASPLLLKLQFDFNPLDLSPRNAEAVVTLRDLANDPQTDPNTIEILAPSLAGANDLAERLRQLPQVARVTTLQNFIPSDQDQKLIVVQRTAKQLHSALNPTERAAAPDDAADIEALKRAAQGLNKAAAVATAEGSDAARRLAELMAELAAAPPEDREAARSALLPSLATMLRLVRASLGARIVTLSTLPRSLVRDWVDPEGQARIEVAPSGNPESNADLVRFSDAVRKIAPHATGQPVIIEESGKTVLKAFGEASGWAVLSIAVLLYLALRRVGDVLLTLVPLGLAALVTLELAAVIPLPLNFANIIAFPLLLGIGVAFKIYYIVAWRAGTTNLLETSLTRAVVLSALTTATAFGSLLFSRYPGLSSMGQMLVLALLCTMAAAVLFQPALMGPPRQTSGAETA
ncbi:MAG: MMPL family transporter [Methylocapsa sp.]|nr:MMPL family transporter [Methylocapsa sp.]